MEIRGFNASQDRAFENAFYWFSQPGRIHKLLAHYELYKQIRMLPGDIMELGVYKAASLIRFATFRSALENDTARNIIGFDAFGAFPTDGVKLTDDLEFINWFETQGGDGLSKDEVADIFRNKSIQNIKLVDGNIFDTLPTYLEQHPQTRIALLHLDLDVKEPTAFALSLLYERVTPGGLIVFDDYNAVAGATQVVDDFISNSHDTLKLEKLPLYQFPAFIRKP